MRNISTFGAFTTTRLGIYAAQKGLEVTGNNITNINTTGYTRQRLDQVSFVVGSADKYSSMYSNKVGNGVLMTGVSQLRDPFLDIAYRHASANLGSADAKLAGLEDIARILDEVGNGEDGNGVLLDHLQELSDQLNQMITEGAGHQEYEGLVRTAAKSLVTLFNSYAKDLSELKGRYEEQLKQDTEAVNNILKLTLRLAQSLRLECSIFSPTLQGGNDAVANIHLVIQELALQLEQLPIKFGSQTNIQLSKHIEIQQRTVERANHIKPYPLCILGHNLQSHSL